MRLLQFEDGKFVFTQNLHEPEPYAILSHTWGNAEDEVTYEDIQNSAGRHKKGHVKLEFCRDQATKDGYKYFWIDTCCIDKRNDAELATSIRSMYEWYRNAAVCYVYLSDVSMNKRGADGQPRWQEAVKSSKWFTRGWTLQELIAPAKVVFFARDGRIGDKESLCQMISDITSINYQAFLRGVQGFDHCSRLSWGRDRITSVPEDMSYCLMGICGVVIDPRYGEGKEEARRRLESMIRERYGTIALESRESSDIHMPSSKLHPQQLVNGRETILELLKFDTMESRRKTIRNALARTCKWVLLDPVYLAWMDPLALREHYGFFWIKGKPGAGKSVLVKFLHHYITKTRGKKDIILSFYFNARGEALEKTFLGLYRSLLVQLLLAVPELQSVLDRLDSGSLLEDSKSTISNLQHIFGNAVSQLRDRRLYCFIDAVDECQEEDVERMIQYLRDVQQDALRIGNSFYVCFASRHYPINHIPTRLQLVLEHTEEHKNDLGNYVQENLDRATPRQLEQIKLDILEKAKGIFLWVVIVVDLLKKEMKHGRIHAIRGRLKEIPAGLTKLFQSILQRDQDNIGESAFCLRWILFARRPLDLAEFYFAMMASIDPQQRQELLPEEISNEQMRAFLLSSSKGLAELTKGKETVQFIHESVRDFLVKEEGLNHIELDQSRSVGQIHDKLKEACLRGINVDTGAYKYKAEKDVGGRGSASAKANTRHSTALRTEVTKRFPFLEYATQFILSHSDKAASEVPQHEFLQQFDINNWLEKANLLEKTKINQYKKPLDLVYICAERDLANLITTLVGCGYSIAQDSMQRQENPLFAAFANKSINAARLLLQHSGAPNADEIVHEVLISNYKGKPTFDRRSKKERWHWAVEQGYDNLAQYILLNVKDGKFATPDEKNELLPIAAENGCKNLVKVLIEKGADVNAQGGHYGNALQAALVRGDTQLAQMLIKKGADVNTQGG